MKLLLTFVLLTGIFAEECTADLGIDDFTDRVTVANVSETADAFVAIEFDHTQVTMFLLAGQSRTAVGIAATKYAAKVTDPSNADYEDYRARLVELRDQLEEMTMSPQGASMELIASMYSELALVQSTLNQLQTSSHVQSCGGRIESGVTSQVTVKWTRTSDEAALWALACS